MVMCSLGSGRKCWVPDGVESKAADLESPLFKLPSFELGAQRWTHCVLCTFELCLVMSGRKLRKLSEV